MVVCLTVWPIQTIIGLAALGPLSIALAFLLFVGAEVEEWVRNG